MSKFEIWNLKFGKDKLLKEQKSQCSKHLTFNAQKCWMSQRLWKHEEFMMKEERELFRSSFLTARKQHVSTQSESESETSTKKSIRRFDKEFLFDMSTESSNMTTMNFFQQEQDESLKFQENLKSKSFSFKMISQQ